MPYILIPGADGRHRSEASLAFECQERAKGKQSRGRARVRNKENRSKDSSTQRAQRANTGSPGKGSVCSEDRVNMLWNGYRVISLEQDSQGVYMESQAPSIGYRLSYLCACQQMRLILKNWGDIQIYSKYHFLLRECPVGYVVKFSRPVNVFIFS